MDKGTIRALIVENDSIDEEFLIRSLLRTTFKYDFKTFSESEDALEYLGSVPAEEAPHVMILDLGLPDMHGLELLKKIKAIAGYKDTPVLILTGSENPNDIKQTYREGGTIFMNKPVQDEMLKTVMEQLVIRKRMEI